MANYFLNDDGSISSNKNKTIGNNYTLNNDGTIKLNSSKIKSQSNVTKKKKQYEEEKAKQNDLKNNIVETFSNQGVMVTSDGFGNTTRAILPTQKQSQYANEGFSVSKDSLTENVKKEQKYNEIKNSEEYKQQKEELTQQANAVGYAKYDYDKAIVDGTDVTTIDKFLSPIVTGAKQLFDIGGGLVQNDRGAYQYLPSQNEQKFKKVMDSYETGIGRFYGNTTHELGKIGSSTALNLVAPYVGSTIYYNKIFMDATNSAVSNGYDISSATAYGLVNTALEFGVGKILGSATKGLTGGKTSGYEEFLNAGFSKFLSKPLSKFLANAGSEATEEFIQEYLDNFSKLILLEKSTDPNDYVSVLTNKEIFADAVYSAAIGGVTGGIIGTISSKDSNIENKDIYRTFKEELEVSLNNTTDENTINEINTLIGKIENATKNNIQLRETDISTIYDLIENSQNNSSLNNLSMATNSNINDINTQQSIVENNNQTDNDQNILKVSNLINSNNVTNNDNISSSSNVTLPSVKNSNSTLNTTNSTSSNGSKISIPSNLEANDTSANPIVNTLSISPNTIATIKAIQTSSTPGMTYTAENISNILKDIGIEVPSSFRYVDRVKSDLTYTTTKELTPVEYSSISNALSQLRNIDVTSVNNINQALTPVDISQIRQVKGNIPINQDLLNKYATVREIFDNESINYDGVVKVKNMDIDITNKSATEIYHMAVDIFKSNHNTNIFDNNGNKIKVTNQDIKESINKIYNDRLQNKYLKEHVKIFSDLGDIIEKSKLVNQTPESKGRIKYNTWNYYYNGLNINNELYNLEFDVVSRTDGENHYRLQRLEKADTQSTLPINGEVDFGASAFYDNNIPQSNENVKSGISNNINIQNGTKYSKNIKENGENHYRVQRLEKQLSKKMESSAENIANSNITSTYEDSISNENIPQINRNVKLPIANNNNMQNNDMNTKKILNPNEISQLIPEDANTTPRLPNIKRNRINNGESHFATNINDKTNMLTEKQKQTILSDEETRYYDTITNKDSLNKAFDKLNENGQIETLNWFSKDSEQATSTDVAEGWILLKQYADNNDADGMVAVAKKLRDMGTKAGQTVQAFNIMARMTPEGMVKYAQTELMEAYDKMVKGKTKKWIEQHQKNFDLTPQETSAIMTIMDKVSTMPDGYEKRVELAKIQKIMTDKLPPQKGAGIKAWMRISMLFNPKTQVRNVVGNAIIAPVNSFSDLFASIVDKSIGTKTGYRTTGVINIQKYVKGFKEGLYQSYNDFRKDINTRNIQGNRFEIREGKSFDNDNIIGKSLNRVDSLLSFMLDAGDRSFYEATFTNSINNQLVLNDTSEVTQDMIDIATQEALARTWQDNNNYTSFVLSVRRMLNNINVKGYGLGDVLIPFAKTPANLTKAIVDYSPAGLVNTLVKGKNLKNAIATNQITPKMQYEFVQTLGKATAGTMLYVIGYALAKAGITSGKSDDDKDVQNFVKNTLGINSYSIKIGDKSFTYDWAQPIAAPLSIMANIVQKDNEDASTLEKVLSSLDTAGNILLEQSFMESINTALSNNNGLATGIQEAILDLPARAIPTLMKQVADMIDGTQRTSFEYDKPLESMVNSVKSKIPFLSKTLAPSVDSMGREIQKYGGKNNIFNVFFNPANVNTENISNSSKEIYRLYKSTGETNIMPRVAPYYINQDGEKIILDSNQRAEYQKTSGKIIEDNINKLLKMPEYKSMSDTKKAEVINDIVNYSYNIAKKEVLGIELSDTYEKAEQYSRIGNISDYYTFKNSIDNTNSQTKKESIVNYLINSNLKDNQIAVLYGNYYSNATLLNCLFTTGVPIKEFIKFNSQEFTTDYYTNGKAVPNSRKKKVIQYINGLSLSIPQKALLIKLEYNSYKTYDKQIAQYINSKNIDFLDKSYILKKAGFNSYDKQIINYVNNMDITKIEKEEVLEEMGFKIRNGKVYSK